MIIETYGERWSFIDYKGRKQVGIVHGFENRDKMYQLEYRWGKEYRNNDPENPRIPNIGDKVRLDSEFSYTVPSRNSAVGIIINKDNFDFYTFQDEKTKEQFLIKPLDIQWYYN